MNEIVCVFVFPHKILYTAYACIEPYFVTEWPVPSKIFSSGFYRFHTAGYDDGVSCLKINLSERVPIVNADVHIFLAVMHL